MAVLAGSRLPRDESREKRAPMAACSSSMVVDTEMDIQLHSRKAGSQVQKQLTRILSVPLPGARLTLAQARTVQRLNNRESDFTCCTPRRSTHRSKFLVV